MKIRTMLIIAAVPVLLAGCAAAAGPLAPAALAENENTQAGSIILSNLAVKPVDQSGFCDIKNLEYGEDILITVDAVNLGPVREGRDIVLYIDWKVYQTRHITLGPGEKAVIVFELMIDTRPDGIYHVAIDELWSSFGVG